MTGTRPALTRSTPKQVGAYQAGRAAHAAGLDSTAVPYSKDAPDPDGLRTLWIRGYCDNRRDAVHDAAAAGGVGGS